MSTDHFLSTAVWGPFCRLRTSGEGQSETTAVLQALSGEVWGRSRLGEPRPVVEAHGRALRDGESGIEFYALAPPNNRWGPRPVWDVRGPHLRIETDDRGEVAKLGVAFVRITQDLFDVISNPTS